MFVFTCEHLHMCNRPTKFSLLRHFSFFGNSKKYIARIIKISGGFLLHGIIKKVQQEIYIEILLQIKAKLINMKLYSTNNLH